MSVLVTGAGHLGDIPLGATFGFKFNTHQANGTPIGGTLAIQVYKRGSTTEDNSGITYDDDHDTLVGLHDVIIDLSADATFYASGGDFQAFIITGTIDGVSVVGTVVASWSIGKGVDVTRLGGSAQSLLDQKDFADTGYDPATHNVAEVDSVGSLAAQAKLDVGVAVEVSLGATTRTLPAQVSPPVAPTVLEALLYPYKADRNKETNDGTTIKRFADNGTTVDQKAGVSSAAGVVIRGEFEAGP